MLSVTSANTVGATKYPLPPSLKYKRSQQVLIYSELESQIWIQEETRHILLCFIQKCFFFKFFLKLLAEKFKIWSRFTSKVYIPLRNSQMKI